MKAGSFHATHLLANRLSLPAKLLAHGRVGLSDISSMWLNLILGRAREARPACHRILALAKFAKAIAGGGWMSAVKKTPC
jgi:hypothetical protein